MQCVAGIGKKKGKPGFSQRLHGDNSANRANERSLLYFHRFCWKDMKKDPVLYLIATG